MTFGGAWSNHIAATAALCKSECLNAIGIIRGEKSLHLSPTLLQAKESGMSLHFISRKEYKEKKIPFDLQKDDYYVIPEGGYGKQGAEGARTILDHCEKENFTHYCCAVGTGTMMAGLVNGSLPGQVVTGISVLKNNTDLENSIKSLITNSENIFTVIPDYHFGGYAKYNADLIRFMNEFYKQTHIPSDFVYTGKLFFALYDLAQKNYFSPGSKVLTIHSGGLQGNQSLPKGQLTF